MLDWWCLMSHRIQQRQALIDSQQRKGIHDERAPVSESVGCSEGVYAKHNSLHVLAQQRPSGWAKHLFLLLFIYYYYYYECNMYLSAAGLPWGCAETHSFSDIA